MSYKRSQNIFSRITYVLDIEGKKTKNKPETKPNGQKPGSGKKTIALNLTTNKKTRLAAILILAIFLRLYFMVGLANCQSQDDGLYVNAARRLTDGFGIYNPKDIEQTILNPALIPPSRVGFVYSMFFIYKIFGISDLSSVLLGLAASIGSVILLYYWGASIEGETTGIACALLAAVYPLDVVYSTRIFPDVPMVFFITLSMFSYIRGLETGKRGYCLLAGFSLGVGYLMKELAIIMFPVLIFYTIVKKKGFRYFPYLVAGFVLAFAIELVFFYFKTGDPFFRIQTLAKAHFGKIVTERWDNEKDIAGIVRVIYPVRYNFLGQMNRLFNEKPWRTSWNYTGWFMHLVPISIAYILLKWRKQAFIAAAWFVLFLLYIEFGFTDIALNTTDHSQPLIRYMMIFKESDSAKLFNILTAPTVLCLGVFVGSLLSSRFWPVRLLASILLLFLIASSLYFIESTSSILNDGMSDIRMVRDFLKTQPTKPVYVDYLGAGQLDYYSGCNDTRRFINIYGTKANEIKDAYVVVGGSRGCDITGRYVLDLYPNYTENPPPNWQKIASFNKPLKPYRSKMAEIYYVAGDTK